MREVRVANNKATVNGREVDVFVENGNLSFFVPLSKTIKIGERNVGILLLKRRTADGQVVMEATGSLAGLNYTEQRPWTEDKNSREAFAVKVAHETIGRVVAREVSDNLK